MLHKLSIFIAKIYLIIITSALRKRTAYQLFQSKRQAFGRSAFGTQLPFETESVGSGDERTVSTGIQVFSMIAVPPLPGDWFEGWY